jgi:hypothetical protein
MKKSGLADSPFFPSVTSETKDVAPPPDEPPKQQTEQKPAEPALPMQEKSAQEKPAKEETLHASMHARKHANMHATIQTSMHANMQPYLSAKATNSFAFRYPPDLLEKLADMLHQIRKQHHRKLTKNAIAVAALTFLLTDFEIYGEESMLYQLLIKTDS